MSWRTRTVLATTAGVALVGAGALTVAYAADSVPSPAPSLLVSSPSHDPQVDALTAEARTLQAQVAALEQAVANEPTPVPVPVAVQLPREPSEPSSSAPRPSSAEPVAPTTEPEHTAAPTGEPSHESDHDQEQGEGEHGGSDD